MKYQLKLKAKTSFAVVAFLLLLLLSSTGHAQNWTGYTGGSGGSNVSTASCGGRMIVGIEALTGNVVDRIRLLCRSITSSGTNTGSVQRSAWAGASGGQTVRKLECPSNHMVVKIQGATKQYGAWKVLGGLRIYCHYSDASFTARGNGVKREFSLGNVSWKELRRCPNTSNVPRRGLGIGMRVAYGLVADKVALACNRNGRVTSDGGSNNGGNSPSPTPPQAAPWGWSNPFTADDVEDYKLPNNMIGKAMKDIVQGNSVVRSDGKKCKDCHMGSQSAGDVSWNQISSAAPTSQLLALCNQDSDDNNRKDFRHGFQYAWGKPENLKKLFWHWQHYNCRK